MTTGRSGRESRSSSLRGNFRPSLTLTLLTSVLLVVLLLPAAVRAAGGNRRRDPLHLHGSDFGCLRLARDGHRHSLRNDHVLWNHRGDAHAHSAAVLLTGSVPGGRADRSGSRRDLPLLDRRWPRPHVRDCSQRSLPLRPDCRHRKFDRVLQGRDHAESGGRGQPCVRARCG